MATRARLSDPLQVGRFHVLDMSFSLPPVLIPLFGFTRITLPKLNVELQNIKEGNYEFPRKVVKGASVGTIVLEQGVSLINSDFGDWARKSVIGRTSPKNLLIVQFHGKGIFGGGTLGIQGTAGKFLPFEFAARLPGRAWMCKMCRPTGYGNSDLDALDQSVSIATLEIECEEFEELSFGI